MKNVLCLTIDVREYNNEIIFMHKIVPGVANRSYGIHVAKMAGMPDVVINRAEAVLAALEGAKPAPKHTNTPSGNNGGVRAKSKLQVRDGSAPQLSLFGE